VKQKEHIRCPKCDWEPYAGCLWVCDVCKTKWDTFDTHGQCPGCRKIFIDTQCPKSKGGCGEMSLNADWYEYLPIEKSNFTSLFSWKKKDKLPVTAMDKKWTENGLILLAETFEPIYFRSLTTITPDKQYFDRKFDRTEADAEYILGKVASIMNVKLWEIQLMFYSNEPIEFSEGIVSTPQEKLNKGWHSPSGKYIDHGLGHKEIWIELRLLKDTVNLTARIAHELANYKLLSEYGFEEKDEQLSDLACIVFGFGIFLGNSFFKFSQWTGGTHQGWRMKRNGFLPEQIIAYAMAWLAHYRNEDIAWKQYLDKTILKYFDQSYEYISQNKDIIKWE